MQKQQVLELQATYDAMCPDACTHCAGQGYSTWVENQSPIGSGLYWPEEMSEACDWCLVECKCPRCGFEHTTEWANANLDHPMFDGSWPHPCDWCGFTGVEDGRPNLTWWCDDDY